MTKHLLIIEDNEQNYYMMSFLLKKNGYEVRVSTNGKDGIASATQNTPDAILLDIQLPEMDGYAVATELIKVSALKNTPIIAVTSYAMAGDREKILAAGAYGYIEKPINPDTFVQEINDYISSFKQQRRE